MPEKISQMVKHHMDTDHHEASIDKTLETIRAHLGMEVAYLSEFIGDESVFRAVNAPGLEDLIKVDDRHSLDDVYCRHILEGRLPELIPDTADEPVAAAMPITAAVPIGSHMSLPIRKRDGTPYGMFCCLSSKPNKTLTQRDLETMRIFADLAADHVNSRLEITREFDEKHARIKSVIAEQAFHVVYQPIWNFAHQHPAGFEALCRFEGQPYRTPDIWFSEAADVGLAIELELAVIRKAIEVFNHLPDACYVSFNASPETVVSGKLDDLLAGVPTDRFVLEITEHAQVADYEQLLNHLTPLRNKGLRVAVDDAGAGFSSLQHIVQLAPDLIKLDMSLTRNVDTDQARRSLANALIYFARETSASIIAEGIETPSELETLKVLGIQKGQGYLLGKPANMASAIELMRTKARASHTARA